MIYFVILHEYVFFELLLLKVTGYSMSCIWNYLMNINQEHRRIRLIFLCGKIVKKCKELIKKVEP